MKKIIIASLLILSACAHNDTGLARPAVMPDLPPALAKKAERLPDITDPTMAGAHIDGADTDMKYNGVAFQLNAIIDAWGCVKQALSEKTNIEKCFND